MRDTAVGNHQQIAVVDRDYSLLRHPMKRRMAVAFQMDSGKNTALSQGMAVELLAGLQMGREDCFVENYSTTAEGQPKKQDISLEMCIE